MNPIHKENRSLRQLRLKMILDKNFKSKLNDFCLNTTNYGKGQYQKKNWEVNSGTIFWRRTLNLLPSKKDFDTCHMFLQFLFSFKGNTVHF